jgi:hypothetical protein
MENTDDLIDYILGEIVTTVPLIGTYTYKFGKFYRNHPRLKMIHTDVYINEYNKLYDIHKIIQKLREICPYYNSHYDDINEVIHVRAKV